MSSVQDYKFIYKKWYFWIPLLFMSIAYYSWIKFLFFDLGRDSGWVSFLMLIFLITNTYLLFFSYFFIKRVVHRICGFLMVVLMILSYVFCRIYEFDMLYLFGFDTITLNLLSGLILIAMSLIKINRKQTDQKEIQPETADHSESILFGYKLISQKWYFWIPLVMTLIASIPWLITLVLIYGGYETFLTYTIISVLALYAALLAGVYTFISRRSHLFCGILMILLSIGLVGIGNIPIMADSKMMWFAYHSISMLLNFVSGLLLVVFSLFFHSKR